MKKSKAAVFLTVALLSVLCLPTKNVEAKTKPIKSVPVESTPPVASRPTPKPETPIFALKGKFIPSGWMGDYGDLKFNGAFLEGTVKVMKISYSALRKQEAGWAGIYWQNRANNWGDKKGGFDLRNYRYLRFRAKGEKGDELIDKFFVGGISGQTEEGDTDQGTLGQVELTKAWKDYEIDLRGIDLSHIIGGFGFAVSADTNEKGLTMYLDNIRFEK